MNTFIKLQLTFVLFYGTIFSKDLELKLSLDTTHYLRAQSIWSQVSLCNTTNRTQEVQPLILDESVAGVHFIVKDNAGKILLPTNESITDIFGDKKIKIVPQDTLTECFNILDYFCNSGIKRAESFLKTEHYLTEGKYSVQVWTYTGFDTLYSNSVSVIVTTPSLKEGIVLQELSNAEQLFKRELGKPENTSISLFDEIRQKYSWSVYIPQVYRHLIFLTHSLLNNSPKASDLALEFAKSHPNNSGAVKVLSNRASLFIEEGKKNVLEELRNKYPNTKIGKYCKRKLSEIK